MSFTRTRVSILAGSQGERPSAVQSSHGTSELGSMTVTAHLGMVEHRVPELADYAVLWILCTGRTRPIQSPCRSQQRGQSGHHRLSLPAARCELTDQAARSSLSDSVTARCAAAWSRSPCVVTKYRPCNCAIVNSF